MIAIAPTMARHKLRAMVLLHAELVAQAEAKTREADRLDRTHEPERAEMARDDAEEIRARAEYLADLLGPQGVLVPDPRQLSLVGLGDAA